MADEQKTIIIDVQVEDKDFDQAIGEVNSQLRKNRQEIKELSKDYEANAKEIAKLEGENRDLSKSKRELIKESKTESNSLAALRLELAKQVKERNELNTSTEDGARRFAELQKSIKGLNDQISGFEQEGGDFRRNVGNYPSLANSASAAFNKLWTTLKANPLLLLAGAVAGLIKIFKESQTGAEFFRKTSAALNTTLGFLSDLVENLGGRLINLFENPKQALVDFGNLIKTNLLTRFEGILEFIPQIGKAIKLLFEGEFAEAGQVAADAVGKVVLGVENITEKVSTSVVSVVEWTKAINEGTQAAFNLETQLIANEKVLADLAVTQAQSLASQKELNRTIEDTTLSYEERIAAAEKFAEVEDDLIAQQIAAQEERLRILKEQNDITNSTEEDLQRVRDAEIELANLQAASDERQVTNQNKLNALRAQQAAENKKQDADRLKDLQKQWDAEAKAYDKEIADEKALIALKKKNDAEALNSTISSLKGVGKLSKGLTLAEIGLDTAQAISGLTANSESNPANAFTFGGAGIAQFASGLARIAANMASAQKFIKGGGGGGPSVSTSGGGGIAAGGLATVNASLLSQFSAPAQNDANLSQALSSAVSSMPPAQVAVVDINTAQSQRSVKVTEASL